MSSFENFCKNIPDHVSNLMHITKLKMLFQTGLSPLCIGGSMVQESTYICCRGQGSSIKDVGIF